MTIKRHKHDWQAVYSPDDGGWYGQCPDCWKMTKIYRAAADLHRDIREGKAKVER